MSKAVSAARCSSNNHIPFGCLIPCHPVRRHITVDDVGSERLIPIWAAATDWTAILDQIGQARRVAVDRLDSACCCRFLDIERLRALACGLTSSLPLSSLAAFLALRDRRVSVCPFLCCKGLLHFALQLEAVRNARLHSTFHVLLAAERVERVALLVRFTKTESTDPLAAHVAETMTSRRFGSCC